MPTLRRGERVDGALLLGLRHAARAQASPPTARSGRSSSILFVDVVGFTGRAELLDPEDVGRLLTPFYGHVRAELERFGGTVEKFIGDAVMAIFGVPAAHEDDPERAVRAAFGVRDVIEELNAADPRARARRFGSASRPGRCSSTSAPIPRRGETTVAGDVVNTAARLQQTAPAGSHRRRRGTYEAHAEAVEYRALEPIVAKGKRDRYGVGGRSRCRVRSAIGSAPGHAPLVGRREELELVAIAPSIARAASSRYRS